MTSRTVGAALVRRTVSRLWDTLRVMTAKRSYLPWIALAVLGALAGAWFASRDRAPSSSQTPVAAAPAPALQAGTWMPAPRDIGSVDLVDMRGQPFDHSGFEGLPSVVFFGFTNCPDVCPTTLALIAQAMQAFDDGQVRVFLVTVDPDRDTPEVLAKYVAHFNPDFTGLTGSPEALKTLAKNLSAAVARVDLPGGDYTMDHSATIYFLDGEGRLRAVFTPPHSAPALAADLHAAIAASRG